MQTRYLIHVLGFALAHLKPSYPTGEAPVVTQFFQGFGISFLTLACHLDAWVSGVLTARSSPHTEMIESHSGKD